MRMFITTLRSFSGLGALAALLVPVHLFAQNLAFVSDRDGNYEIYVANIDGSGAMNITNNPASDTNPRWSPDGTKILFVSDRDGNSEIYVMNADGSGLKNLTNSPAHDVEPKWSPDGSRILFLSGTDPGRPYAIDRIYAVNADGSGLVQLAELPEIVVAKWSPDGAKVLFNTVSYLNNLYVVNADGTSQRILWDNPGDGADDPQWSPDSTKILLSSDNYENYSIYTVQLDGTRVTLSNS